jgi:hypothetical protein
MSFVSKCETEETFSLFTHRRVLQYQPKKLLIIRSVRGLCTFLVFTKMKN